MNSNQPPLEKFWTPEPITAWRVFQAFQTTSESVPRLNSVTQASLLWEREMPPAYCHKLWAWDKTSHQTPGEQCSCGYWSLKPEHLDKPHTWKVLNPWDVNAIILWGALGWVEQWGEIIEGTKGYRSERVKITAFIDLPDEVVSKHVDDVQEAWTWCRDIWAPPLERYRNRLHALASMFDVPVVVHG